MATKIGLASKGTGLRVNASRWQMQRYRGCLVVEYVVGSRGCTRKAPWLKVGRAHDLPRGILPREPRLLVLPEIGVGLVSEIVLWAPVEDVTVSSQHPSLWEELTGGAASLQRIPWNNRLNSSGSAETLERPFGHRSTTEIRGTCR